MCERSQIIPDKYEDPYLYTKGKWLVQDDAERTARLLKFDFQALCEQAIAHSTGAKRVDRVERKDGSYNRVFVFHMDNGKKVVGRIPTSAAGPARLVTSSEIATIAYLQRNTTIPIPRILDWSDDPTNRIGSEYLLMEHAEGIELRQIWFNLDIDVQITCIHHIMEQVKHASFLNLPAYGSIYFESAVASLAIDHVPLDDDFCIGPHCGRIYWDCTPGEKRYYDDVPEDRGPWQGPSAYTSSLINAGLSRLPRDHDMAKCDRRAARPFQGSAIEHRELLKAAQNILQVVTDSPLMQKTSTPTLLHPDLHMSNIFVDPTDPTRITGIIDWQGTSINPVFMALLPILNFAIPQEYASQYDEREAEGRATHRQYWYATLDVCLQANKHLVLRRDIDDDLLRPFHFCYRTWKDSLPAAAREMNVLLDRWSELKLPGNPPCDVDIRAQLRDFESDFETYTDAERLRLGLESAIGAENGWVPLICWEEAQQRHEHAYKTMMEVAKEPDSDMSPEHMQAIWPFDIPYQ